MKLLVLHSGSIGDTVIILPILKELRRLHPEATIDIFNYSAYQGQRCLHELLGRDSPWVDHIDGFTFRRDWRMVIDLIKAARRARRNRYDVAVNLDRTTARGFALRTRLWGVFFRLLGIRKVTGNRAPAKLPRRNAAGYLPKVEHHLDLLYRRLQCDYPAMHREPPDAMLSVAELAQGRRLCQSYAIPPDAIVLGVGPGGKKLRWPPERFQELLARLIAEKNIFPIFFAGPEDADRLQQLIAALGRGVAPQGLTLRETMAVMGCCAGFIGNDTGTIHMAAAAGLRCIGLYSSSNYPGIWSPYGPGHRVLRHAIRCEGCRKNHCEDTKCLNAISVDAAFDAVGELLQAPCRSSHS